MPDIVIREALLEDAENFIMVMKRSESFHAPWVTAPITLEEFESYIQKPDQLSYLVLDHHGNIVGAYNISGIVRGHFQSAYLGYYVVADFANKGYMSAGLKLLLKKIFTEINLHRIEANIQPENVQSIWLVKKNGFRYEGYAPNYLRVNDEWKGHEHWAMTYEDYQENMKIN